MGEVTDDADLIVESQQLPALHRGFTLLERTNGSSIVASPGNTLKLKVDGEVVCQSDQVKRVDVSGLWLPSIEKSGEVKYHENGGYWLEFLLTEKGFRKTYQEGDDDATCLAKRKQAREEALRYITDLEVREVQVCLYSVNLPGEIPLYYYEVGKISPGLNRDMPTGLIGVVEGWAHIRSKLELGSTETKLTEKGFVFFDVSDYQHEVTRSTKNEILLMTTANKGRRLLGEGYADIGSCTITTSGGYREISGTGQVVVDRVERQLTTWHELGHIVAREFGIILDHSSDVVSEGFAVLCSVIAKKDLGDVVLMLKRYWNLPQVEAGDLYRLFRNEPDDEMQKNVNYTYGLSGAFMWHVFDRLGGAGLKKFCALINGDQDNPLVVPEPDCKEKLLLALETTGGIDTTAEDFVESFIDKLGHQIGFKNPPPLLSEVQL